MRLSNNRIRTIMTRPPKAAETANLPQYQTPHFRERFLQAAHDEGSEIERSPNQRGTKLVDGQELTADALNYFVDNKAALEEEFYSDLFDAIGSKAGPFCEVIATDWYDGMGLRNGDRVSALKASVKRYLVRVAGPDGAATKTLTG